MISSVPSYIVAELPTELAAWVKSIRETYEPAIAHLPEEITLTGSSGVGAIVEGQALNEVGKKIERAIKGKLQFTFSILGINHFRGTDIYYAEPEREGFDQLHKALKDSGIKFKKSPYPYNPHCSLKGYTPLEAGQKEELESLVVPKGKYQIKCISVFEMENMQPRKLLSFV